MLASIFFALIVVSLLIGVVGFTLDIPVFVFVGMICVFLLGMTLLQEGLTYKSGFDETYVYGANFSGYHWDYNTSDAPDYNPSEDPAFLFHVNGTDSYSRYDDASHMRLGYFVMMLGALGFVLGLFKL
jgi:hypothetical protein